MARPRNPQINHGTNYGYQKCRQGTDGGRCPECRTWNSERMQQYRAPSAAAGKQLAGLLASLTRPAGRPASSSQATRTLQAYAPPAPVRSQAPAPPRPPAATGTRPETTRTPAPGRPSSSPKAPAEIKRLCGLLGYNPAAVSAWEGTPDEILGRLQGLARGRGLI